MNSIPHAKKIGKVIRHRRHELEISQPELARRSGLDVFTVCRIEGGTRQSLRTLSKLASAFGTTLAQLLSEAENI